MKTPIIYELIVLLALMTEVKLSHAGVRPVIRLPRHDVVARAAVATTGEWIVITSAGRIENIPNTVRAGGYIRQYKYRSLPVGDTRFNLEVMKISQWLASDEQ
ncbi:MAG: hypothetical protein PHG00_14910 [Methylococcales bacterium]|nr:hypothetical protein [Methylococcales bacterium]